MSTKLTRDELMKLSEEEQEVFDVMKNLAALNVPWVHLVNREMTKRGRSERRTNIHINILVLLQLISLTKNGEKFEVNELKL